MSLRRKASRRGAQGGSGRKNLNRLKPKIKLNDHLVQSDISGQTVLASETVMTWKGLRVHKNEYDPRHPQLDIHYVPENIAVDDPRPFSGVDAETGELLNDDESQ